eukprot:TRINITY_DN1150_c0_g1_i1.p1 TRINITY_DN1150_c0_g1~~TRINITY_DN1150_c0_g1_i1.p1  ORF type:complete len:198 (-),score=69.04 TRINITY_DN1150_c0_g1_i1:100-693(-)
MAKVCVVLGSVREGRMGLRVANMIMKNLAALGAEPILLDPLEINAPLLSQPLHFMKDQSQAPQWMLDTHQKIKDADGFVIVTAEYNCSLPPALTNLLDHFPLPSYRHKPASIASYSMGSLGGTRAAALARPFLSELGMVTLPSVVLIPTVQNAKIAEDGEVDDNERVVNSSNKMCKELVWYMDALQTQAEKAGGNPN